MKKVTQCRSCGSTALTPVFSIENAPEANAGGALRGLRKAKAASWVLCDPAVDVHACGLVQAKARQDELPDNWIPSGVFRSTRSHLRAVATEALELISGRDCAALDIGCSDGTLLSFYPRWVERFGVDSDAAVDKVGAWAWTARAPFPSAEVDRALGEKKFDIVTAVSVLEQLEEPRAFLARIKSLLAADGVVVIETRYAPMVLTRGSVEAIQDGARAIYSLGVLERLLRDCDLKIFKGALTDKAGGSVRLFVTHADIEAYDFDPWYERLARLWDEENALALRLHAPYQAFENRVAAARSEFAELMASLKKKGKSAHIVVAGPSAAMHFQWAGGARDAIEAAISFGDIAPCARLATGGPPLISEAASRAAEPDCLIVPQSLKREIMERWRDQIMRGAELLVTGPRPHLVHAGNFASEFGKALAGGDGAGGVETLRAILGAAGGPRLVVDSAARAAG